MNQDLISFDLDGTLVDTASEIAEAANLALESHGIGRRPMAEIALLIGAGTHSLMLRLLEQCFTEQPELRERIDPEAVLQSLDEHYAATTGTQAVPYPGCTELLDELRDAGVTLACVTNKEFRHAKHLLETIGLADRFEILIGGDTLPERKPHASVLQHVAQHFGVPLERMAHLGDSAIDVAAARQSGVAAWAVSYGYNAGRPIAQSDPDVIFDSLPAVGRHIFGRH